jgi:hypothetical protein
MVRTQIYLTEEERAGLLELAKTSGKKQSELIREAIDRFLTLFDDARYRAVMGNAAGMWKDRDDLPDFRAFRKSWDRD